MENKENEGGRPLIFNSKEELEEAINAYYAECEEKEKPLSISGLADALGVCRKTLTNYANRDEFLPTIKKAKAKVERDSEERLIGGKGNATGIIFSLKNNFGWEDTSKVDNTINLKNALVDFGDGNG